jgi:hypothetical protein
MCQVNTVLDKKPVGKSQLQLLRVYDSILLAIHHQQAL